MLDTIDKEDLIRHQLFKTEHKTLICAFGSDRIYLNNYITKTGIDCFLTVHKDNEIKTFQSPASALLYFIK